MQSNAGVLRFVLRSSLTILEIILCEAQLYLVWNKSLYDAVIKIILHRCLFLNKRDVWQHPAVFMVSKTNCFLKSNLPREPVPPMYLTRQKPYSCLNTRILFPICLLTMRVSLSRIKSMKKKLQIVYIFICFYKTQKLIYLFF